MVCGALRRLGGWLQAGRKASGPPGCAAAAATGCRLPFEAALPARVASVCSLWVWQLVLPTLACSTGLLDSTHRPLWMTSVHVNAPVQRALTPQASRPPVTPFPTSQLCLNSLLQAVAAVTPP